jgi:hypothetical protein
VKVLGLTLGAALLGTFVLAGCVKTKEVEVTVEVTRVTTPSPAFSKTQVQTLVQEQAPVFGYVEKPCGTYQKPEAYRTSSGGCVYYITWRLCPTSDMIFTSGNGLWQVRCYYKADGPGTESEYRLSPDGIRNFLFSDNTGKIVQ